MQEKGIKRDELEEKLQEYVSFQLTRKVTHLYKNFLFILEDLKSQGYDISDEDFQRCRKRILDHGNDTVREIEDCLKDLDIRLK
jgi:hypothetical protein|tara:strand:- start:661 stop:912 length:252 start_codon:yes stop_codon:yes gene_type:complete